jgi:hypothetical protein
MWDRLLDPQYWHDRAEEALRHAEETREREMHHLWLRIAEGHERQARMLEQERDRFADGLRPANE